MSRLTDDEIDKLIRAAYLVVQTTPPLVDTREKVTALFIACAAIVDISMILADKPGAAPHLTTVLDQREAATFGQLCERLYVRIDARRVGANDEATRRLLEALPVRKGSLN